MRVRSAARRSLARGGACSRTGSACSACRRRQASVSLIACSFAGRDGPVGQVPRAWRRGLRDRLPGRAGGVDGVELPHQPARARRRCPARPQQAAGQQPTGRRRRGPRRAAADGPLPAVDEERPRERGGQSSRSACTSAGGRSAAAAAGNSVSSPSRARSCSVISPLAGTVARTAGRRTAAGEVQVPRRPALPGTRSYVCRPVSQAAGELGGPLGVWPSARPRAACAARMIPCVAAAATPGIRRGHQRPGRPATAPRRAARRGTLPQSATRFAFPSASRQVSSVIWSPGRGGASSRRSTRPASAARGPPGPGEPGPRSAIGRG